MALMLLPHATRADQPCCMGFMLQVHPSQQVLSGGAVVDEDTGCQVSGHKKQERGQGKHEPVWLVVERLTAQTVWYCQVLTAPTIRW